MAALGLWVSWVSGCGGTKPPGGVQDPHSFAGMNASAIRYDCGETRACLDQEDMKPAGNFVDICLSMEADQFSKRPETQANFLSVTRRCSAFSGCEYYNCTKRPDTGFGKMREQQVAYGCQQKIQCEMEQGRTFDNPTIEVNNCVGSTEGTLFNYGISDQNAYDAKFAMCSMLTSCMFVTCYPY
jgi:hypothetical protein